MKPPTTLEDLTALLAATPMLARLALRNPVTTARALVRGLLATDSEPSVPCASVALKETP
jgi:hypothetical protein